MADAFYIRADNGSYEWSEAGHALSMAFENTVKRFLKDRFGPLGEEDYDILDARTVMESALVNVMLSEAINRRLDSDSLTPEEE